MINHVFHARECPGLCINLLVTFDVSTNTEQPLVSVVSDNNEFRVMSGNERDTGPGLLIHWWFSVLALFEIMEIARWLFYVQLFCNLWNIN